MDFRIFVAISTNFVEKKNTERHTTLAIIKPQHLQMPVVQREAFAPGLQARAHQLDPNLYLCWCKMAWVS